MPTRQAPQSQIRSASGATCDILHVVWSGEIGGTERHLAALVGQGHEASTYSHHVCFLDGQGPIGDELVALGLASRLGCRGGVDPRGLLRFARVLSARKPRLVHFHSRTVPAMLVSFQYAKPAPHLYTEHAPGSLKGEWKSGVFYRLLRRRFARFVAIAPAMSSHIQERGVDPARIVTIPHGLTLPVAAPRELRRAPPFAIGVVGRLVPEKRMDVFLEVVAEVRRSADCRAIIVGDGVARPGLVQRAAELGLTDAVVFAGSQRDVIPWLDRLDIFLMTSEFETFGIAALEAMARGVPVVAMPCAGGLPELAKRGGVLLATRDVRACAETIASLLRDPEERSRLRERAAGVASDHAFASVLARLEALYSELLEPTDREPAAQDSRQ